jgi:Na+-translocating ferredoxin:NAD+ oxidoreductase RnfD subunit
MNSFDDFVSFLTTMGFERFIRIFWFFVFLELLRYVVVDFVALLSNQLKLALTKKRRKTHLQVSNVASRTNLQTFGNHCGR